MNEQHDHETEARIRDALANRADTSVASADAIDKIRSGRSSTVWARPFVYAAVAGTVAVIIGAALYLGPNENADPIDTAEYPTITLPPVTTAPPETSEPEVETPTEVPTVPAEFDPRAVNADGISGANLRWHPLDVAAAGLEIPGEYGENTPEATAEVFVVGTLGLNQPVTRNAAMTLRRCPMMT